MKIKYVLHQTAFVSRIRYLAVLLGMVRKRWYALLGMKIGRGTVLPAIYITWPNQVVISHGCLLEHHIHFKCDGIWKDKISISIVDNVFIGTNCEFNIKAGIEIGDNSLIASGCRFIDHDHGIELGKLMHVQHGPEKPIKIGADVWLDCNVIVLKGVTIGNGAVVAAGAVVTKSILPYEIWAGVPARKIGQRS